MSQLTASPGQTVGPFFSFGLTYEGDNRLVHPHSPGALLLTGTVFDGAGDPITDALVEIWQPDATGRIPAERGSLHRDDVTFTGFGRSGTNDDGVYRFWTVNPGRVAQAAPFISAVVFARGLLNKLHTRIYLPDDEAALAADPLLAALDAEERATLIATRDENGWLHHDLRLQSDTEGNSETVFLAFE